MKLKKLLCTALSAALLSTASLAVEPLIAPAPDTAAPTEANKPAYTLTDRAAAPILVWGQAVELGDNRVSLENSNTSDPYQKIIVNITEQTYILDAVTGAQKTFADLKQGENLYAYVGPAMTRSMPPIANAALVLCNLPADFAAPTYAQIQSVTTGENGRTSALTDRDVIFHLPADTEVIAAPGMETAGSLADLKPGTQVLAWYQIVALSLPAQATPTKLMIFPYSYSGYLTANEQGVTLNGAALTLSAKELPQVVDGNLMLPVRKLTEALGCEVLWSAANPNGVTIQQDGKTLYTLTMNQETAVLADGSEIALTAPAKVLGGVTFLPANDFLALHHLKLDGGGVPFGGSAQPTAN